MGTRFLWLACSLLSVPLVTAQENQAQTYRDILKSKEQMMASATIGISPANFIDKGMRMDYWKNFQYNTQWMQYSFGMTNMKHLNEHNQLDTVLLREWTIGANIPIKPWAVGKRLYDIRGALIVPSIGASVGKRRMEDFGSWIGKVTPGVSFQFPYVGIDLKMHTAFALGSTIPGVKKFALIPEIGIKFDGLYNLLDAQRVFIGHSEGTQTSKYTSYSSTTVREGDYLVTTSYRTETTTITPYSFDRYSTIVGPFVAIGPHVSFQSHPYAGETRMGGLGYYVRLGILSSDFLVDAGKLGFASSMQARETIADPSPKSLSKVNKKDFTNAGSYDAFRFQARLGIDLYEIIAAQYGESNVVGRAQAKFTRLIGGIGYGYAMLSNPHYIRANGMQLADEKFESDYTLLTTSGNHAKFAQNGGYLTFFCSIEAGAIRLTFESNRYFRAYLANVNSISIGYLFPYGRIKKKMKAIQTYKNYIRENS